MNNNYKSIYPPPPLCIHNGWVACWEQEKPCSTCAACGWNPTVAQARLERYCAEHGIQLSALEPNTTQAT